MVLVEDDHAWSKLRFETFFLGLFISKISYLNWDLETTFCFSSFIHSTKSHWSPCWAPPLAFTSCQCDTQGGAAPESCQISSQPLKRSSCSQAWRDKASNKRHREPFATIILDFYTALQLTKYLHPLSHPICPVSPLAAQANCPESGCPHSHLHYYSSRTNSNDHSIHEVDNTAAKPARKTIRLGISSLCLVTGKMMLY